MKEWKKKFFTLYIGQAISILTSAVLQMAIVWHVTETTGSAALLSLSTMIGFLPQALLGVFIGVYIDRHSRKRIMIISDLVLAAAGMILVVAGRQGEIPLWLIYIVLFIRSLGNAFHEPSLQAAIPSIVPKEELTRYAGFAHSFKSVSFLISPALAAFLYRIWSLDAIVFFDVIGALLAVFFLTRVEMNEKVHQFASEKPQVLKEAKEGFAALRRVPGLFTLLIVSTLYAFIYFPIGTLFPLITMKWFQGGVEQSGMVEVVFALGMLCGSLLLSHVGKKIHHERAVLASIACYGLCCLSAGLLPRTALYVFVGISFTIGVINPFYHSVRTAIFQTRIEDEYLGRVLSLTNSVGLIAMPLGLTLSGIFADIVGVNRWFMISGILTLILAAAAFISLPKEMLQKNENS